jgi:hypothetical protein
MTIEHTHSTATNNDAGPPKGVCTVVSIQNHCFFVIQNASSIKIRQKHARLKMWAHRSISHHITKKKIEISYQA